VLTNGYQSWSEADLRPPTDLQTRARLDWMIDQGRDPAFALSGEAGVWRSHSLLALIRPDGSGWVGAQLEASRTFAHWEARAEGDRVSVTCTLEGPEVDIAWEETSDVIAALERLSDEMGPQHVGPDPRAATGVVQLVQLLPRDHPRQHAGERPTGPRAGAGVRCLSA